MIKIFVQSKGECTMGFVPPAFRHEPVLLPEVLEMLDPRPGQSVLDVTLGLGGHAEAFLGRTSPDGKLIAFDADAENIRIAQERLSTFEDRLTIHHRNFKTVHELPRLSVDIVFADLGLSSPHIDDASRGFTFRETALLDMRFDRTRGDTAASFLAGASVDDVTSIVRTYGEIPRAKALASALVARFQSVKEGGTTADVRACVEEVFGYKAPSVLPQVFQALRIAVNDELGALRVLLDALPELLAPHGRTGIISYHSLEDRMVKNAFRSLTAVEHDVLTGQELQTPGWTVLTSKPIVPSEAEIRRNSRSRSAKFRAIERIAESD